MTTFDFAPLFRTSVGYDRLASLLNSATRLEQGAGFPPYNIQKAGEDHYRISMAVAGFSEADLTITTENNRLVVTGGAAHGVLGALDIEYVFDPLVVFRGMLVD